MGLETLLMHEPLPGSFAEVKQAGKGGDAPAKAGAPPLPCLNSHNCIQSLSSSHRRTAYALAENVKLMAARFGLEKLGFLTLTFRDHVTDIKEAQKRFHSLASNVLGERYEASISVVERMKSGRIHFHLLVALPEDIRTGFDFEAVSRDDYRSANAWLRKEWAFWRTTAPKYRFGRTELMPVKSTAEGIAKYVGKYIAKHIGNRRSDDTGARLVRYTVKARQVGTQFAWVSPRATLYRLKLAKFAAGFGIKGMRGMKNSFGPRWAFHLGGAIAAEILDVYPTLLHARIDGMDTNGLERIWNEARDIRGLVPLPTRGLGENLPQ
jgi:hypothetical protein